MTQTKQTTISPSHAGAQPHALAQAPPAPSPAPQAVDRTALALFTATVALNAFLLFAIEPMFARMVLPRFGGTAAVWTTCMLFFQAALLAGYAYAHALARIRRPTRQVLLHIALLLLAALALPVSIPTGWAPDPASAPALELLLLLVRRLGAPFFLLAAGAPLLQVWFHRASNGRNPYMLYAASNFASVLALLAYAFILEPTLTLTLQRTSWAMGYGLLLVLVVASGVLSLRKGASWIPHPGSTGSSEPAGAVTLRTRVRWTVLAMVPSSLVLGVTTHLTTDLAPIPLLWIVPLALYLLTFVIAFSEFGALVRQPALITQAYLLTGMGALLLLGSEPPGPLGYAFHLLTFFACALVCHLLLYAERPAPRRLTEYYLWIAFGGMLGGAFNVLVAPQLFTIIAEYPLALVAAATLRPWRASGRRWIDVAGPLLFGAAVLVVSRMVGHTQSRVTPAEVALVSGAAVVMYAFRERPVRFAVALGILAIIGLRQQWNGVRTLIATRSFYGAYRVIDDPDSGTHVLYSGNTVHGSQAMRLPRLPLMYYHPDGPLGDVFAARAPGEPWRVGVVGLGAGASAAYARAEERWTFYEIDPAVARIAEDAALFTYMRDAVSPPRVVLGDARLSLTHEPPGSFDLLVIDAFSSDAIPTHLLTREALAIYRTVLSRGGMIAWHISNKYVDLRPVLNALAHDVGLGAWVRDDTRIAAPEPGMPSRSGSMWAVMTGAPSYSARFDADSAWRALSPDGMERLWTDGFSNVAGVLR